MPSVGNNARGYADFKSGLTERSTSYSSFNVKDTLHTSVFSDHRKWAVSRTAVFVQTLRGKSANFSPFTCLKQCMIKERDAYIYSIIYLLCLTCRTTMTIISKMLLHSSTSSLHFQLVAVERNYRSPLLLTAEQTEFKSCAQRHLLGNS